MFRCNGVINCIGDGGSDEEDCSLILIDDSYLRAFPAPPLKENAVQNPVFISVNIFSILSIQEVESTVSLQFQLNLTWADTRITFRNLKPEPYRNVINSTEAQSIWYPVVAFRNTKHKTKSKVR